MFRAQSNALSTGENQSLPKHFLRLLLCTRWLSPIIFPQPSGSPDVRKEPGASHRQKWQDLEL